MFDYLNLNNKCKTFKIKTRFSKIHFFKKDTNTSILHIKLCLTN